MKRSLSLLALVCLLTTFSIQMSFAQGTSGQKPELLLNKNNGYDYNAYTFFSPNVGDTIGDIRFQGWTPVGGYEPGTAIKSYVTQPVNPESIAANMIFQTGAPQMRMRMTITDNGNVGINTFTPQQLFTVSHGEIPVIRFNRADAGLLDYELYNGPQGKLYFRGGADGVGTDLTDFMVLTDIGRLGLGTINPDQLMTISAPTSPVFRYEQNQAGSDDFETYVATNGSLQFRGGADGTGAGLSDFMALTNIGRLGLGTTSPDQLMTISAPTSPVFRFEQSQAGSDDHEIYVATNGNLQFRGGADGTGAGLTDFVSITTDGDVGIGTNSPTADLSVSRTSNPIFRMDQSNAGARDMEFELTPLGNYHINGGADGPSAALPNLFTLTHTGLVGIGTTTPDQNLTISETTQPVIRLEQSQFGQNDIELSMAANGNYQIMGGADGTGAGLNVLSTLTTQGNLGLGTDMPDQRLTVSDATEVAIRMERSQAGAFDVELVNSTDGDLYFRGGANGTGVALDDLMLLTNEGKLALGTTNTPSDIGGVDISAYTLFATGGILTEELRVRTGWADFVFEDDYQLLSLEEVAEHIEEKGHLPNTPSAQTIESNGLELGACAVDQQIKIEEIYLHLIQLNEKINKLEAENIELKKQLNDNK